MRCIILFFSLPSFFPLLHLPPAQLTISIYNLSSEHTFTTMSAAEQQPPRGLSSHLDILAAISLFILPSILPYLASSLASTDTITDPTSIGDFTSQTFEECAQGASTGVTWRSICIVLLPCLGLVVPVLLSRALTTAEHHFVNRATRPPIRILDTGTITTPRAYTLDNNLSDDTKDLDSYFSSQRWSVPSILPRPKTILAFSLAFWTLLMASSTRMGLSSIAVRGSDTMAANVPSALFRGISTLDPFDSVAMIDKKTTVYLDIFLETDQSVQETPSALDEVLRQQDLDARIAAAERDDVLESEWIDFQPQKDKGTTQNGAKDEEVEDKEYAPYLDQELADMGYVEVSMVVPEMADVQDTTLRVFDYAPGWTEGMVLLLSLCLGGTLVGLAQARTLIRQMPEEFDVSGSGAAQGRHMSLFFGGMISMTAMGLTAWVIMEGLWISPPEYFAGFGIAGVILVQAWVPSTPLQVPMDVVDTNRYDFGDEEKAVDALEGRNACSIDVNSRAELAIATVRAKE